MKFTIEKITTGEDEVILKYRQLNSEVENILSFFDRKQQKLVGKKDSSQIVLDKHSILYIESVDGKTFAYTETDFFKLDYTLNQLESVLNEINFYRCSKSMIINIDRIITLQSLSSNRIDATMCNGEHIIISRTYASQFRKILKGAKVRWEKK